MKLKSTFILALALTVGNGCKENKNVFEMGSYGYDAEFFSKNNIETVELSSKDGMSKVLMVPSWQGRVMTSTTGGNNGTSFGWINHKYIEEGSLSSQFNPFGGEERFWIGPEGGPNSYYFKEGDEQIYANWKVPAIIDTVPFETEKSEGSSSVEFSSKASLTNASGNVFEIGFRRKVSLLEANEISNLLEMEIPSSLKVLAYRSENTLTNEGSNSWTKEGGIPSVWILGCFNPTPTTTVFIPFNEDFEGKKVNDEYFGKVPSDRLILKDGIAYFRIDGKYRAKIGLPDGSAKGICGSYDSEKHILTILKYSVPEGEKDYVNGAWGPQENPFGGDVINSYNDGPTETGTIMGPFYEIETSSPGAALKAGESFTHIQTTIHLEGDEKALDSIASALFGVSLNEVKAIF